MVTALSIQSAQAGISDAFRKVKKAPKKVKNLVIPSKAHKADIQKERQHSSRTKK